MIITAGKYKGRRIKTPKTDVRPTSSKIRQSIFNIIHVDENTRFLDLFAGSGIMGLEALSRGAKKAVFVEKNPQTIKQNLSIAETGASLIVGDAVRVLEKLESFNFIFLDPPYDSDLYEPALAKIKELNLIEDGGFIVVEHDCKHNIEADFEIYKTKKYGDTCLTIFHKP